MPAAVWNDVLRVRVESGQDPDVALEDLLDELAWSLAVPGVRLRHTRDALQTTARLAAMPGCPEPMPWVLKTPVAVVHPDETQADLLQFGLEQAGYRATCFVPTAADGLQHVALVWRRHSDARVRGSWPGGRMGTRPDA